MTVYGVRIKLLDVFVFSLSLVAVIALSIRVYGQPLRRPVAVVSSPEGRWILPLSADQVFTPTALEDGCVVAIQGDSVRVLRSGCPQQICVRTGAISRPGQWIACLPHGVFIQIQGGEAIPVDAINF